jgi:hypothetical protein
MFLSHSQVEDGFSTGGDQLAGSYEKGRSQWWVDNLIARVMYAKIEL